MAHTNDVIFTEQGLAEFIQQIRQNPEMVYKVRAATDEEIKANNYILCAYSTTNPTTWEYYKKDGENFIPVSPAGFSGDLYRKLTLAEGYIPGKGITIIQANGDKFSVAVGSDVKPLNKDIGKYRVGDPGTVTFIVDESNITIPVDGIINDFFSANNDEIPTVIAIEEFVNDSIENAMIEVDSILNGTLGATVGFGFIPGKYENTNKTLTDNQITVLNDNLTTLGVANTTGVITVTNGKASVVLDNDKIKKPQELINLINDKKNELLNNQTLKNYNSLSNEIIRYQNRIVFLKDKNTEAESQISALTDNDLQKIQSDIDNLNEKKTNYSNDINNGLLDLNLSQSIKDAELDNILASQGLLLINDFNLFEGINDITKDSVTTKKLEYTKEDDEYWSLNKWLSIYEVIEKKKELIQINNSIIEKEEEKEQINEQINTLKDTKEINEQEIIVIQNETIPNLQSQQRTLQTEVNNINNKINTIIPATLSLIDTSANKKWTVINTQGSSEIASLEADKVFGAVYNDYAEYRPCANALAGQVVVENGDGSLSLSISRLQLGANIVSDTFGFSIGQTEIANTPIAVAGRALAYPAESLAVYTPGAAVCSGPNGTVSLMTREEIREWPDAIIGYVSEIPTYEYWGTDNIKVNGRVWIKVA